MKTVNIFIGISGSGKSTYAKNFPNAVICSADHFFEKDGTYNWDPTKLEQAHKACQNKFHLALFAKAETIIIDNTNLTKWAIEPYYNAAIKANYQVNFCYFGISVEAALARNVHTVPRHTLVRQSNNLDELLMNWPLSWPIPTSIGEAI